MLKTSIEVPPAAAALGAERKIFAAQNIKADVPEMGTGTVSGNRL
jgi:hypothetical protein